MVLSSEVCMIKDTRMPSGGDLRKVFLLNDLYCWQKANQKVEVHNNNFSSMIDHINGENLINILLSTWLYLWTKAFIFNIFGFSKVGIHWQYNNANCVDSPIFYIHIHIHVHIHIHSHMDTHVYGTWCINTLAQLAQMISK